MFSKNLKFIHQNSVKGTFILKHNQYIKKFKGLVSDETRKKKKKAQKIQTSQSPVRSCLRSQGTCSPALQPARSGTAEEKHGATWDKGYFFFFFRTERLF